jgi:hypothetical protein
MSTTTLPEPTALYRRGWATHPRTTVAEDNAYRRSCVYQAVDAARMQGAAPVTPPDVDENSTTLRVSFGTVKTSTLSDEQRRATDALRDAWTFHGQPPPIVTFFTRFAGYPLGQPPHDWTGWRGGGLTLTVEEDDGQRFVRLTKNGTGVDGATWAKVPQARDAEVYAEFQAQTTNAALGRLKVGARMAGDVGYFGGHGQFTNARLTRYATAFGLIAETDRGQFPPGSRVCVLLRVDGTHLAAKTWLWGTPEPAAWDLQAEDGALYDEGGVGVFTFGSTLGGGQTDTRLFCFGAGIDGAPAPRL